MNAYLRFLSDCLNARKASKVDAYLTLAGVIIAFILWKNPDWLPPEVNEFITASQGWLPWVALVSLETAYRIVMSPYWLHQERAGHIKNLEARINVLEDGNRPKIAIKCSPEIDGCKMPCGGNNQGSVFRVHVTNLGQEPVRECSAVLERIEFDRAKIWNGDHVKLAFQPSEDPDSECKTIACGLPYYLDVIFIERGGNRPWKFSPGTKAHMWRTTPPFDDLFQMGKGVYTFVVTFCTAFRPSSTHRLELRWTGNLDSSEMSLVG